MEFELVDLTFEVTKATGTTPFKVFSQDTDEVILIINYLIEKAGDIKDKKEETPSKKTSSSSSKEKRIRVNDKTASSGWW